METCSPQSVLPLVGLAADKVIRDRYILKPWNVQYDLGLQPNES
ncbi:MAG: hypothetical protein R6U98_03670 [Pirellulaceae bacterium]